jgi:integrase/recombinase XerD
MGRRHEGVCRRVNLHKQLTTNPLDRRAVLAMIKRRAKAAGLPATTCCHIFRVTGIISYMQNNYTLEHARAIAAHASTETTKLYDRSGNVITLDEIEQIEI